MGCGANTIGKLICPCVQARKFAFGQRLGQQIIAIAIACASGRPSNHWRSHIGSIVGKRCSRVYWVPAFAGMTVDGLENNARLSSPAQASAASPDYG